MKRIIIFLINCLLVNYSIGSNPGLTERNLTTTDSIRVLSSPDLYNLSLKWASEYNKISPESKIKVISVKNGRIADNLLEKGEIGFVSNEFYSGFDNESIWKMVVGRDLIVPVFNSNNPYLSEIFQKGISPENFTRFFGNKDSMNWGTLLNGKQNSSANYYFIDDESILPPLTHSVLAESERYA